MGKVSTEISNRMGEIGESVRSSITDALSEAFAAGQAHGREETLKEVGTWSAPFDTLPEEIYHNRALYRLVRGEDKRPLRAEQG